MTQFSLVLATVGRTETLDRLFDSLVGQTFSDFEVIVVDQNPDERVLPMLERARARGLSIQHLRQQEANLSNARNRGMQQARGEVVAFPDDDCWYESCTLQAAFDCFNRELALAGLVANWVEQGEATSPGVDRELLQLGAWRRFRGGHASSISLFLRRDLLQRLEGFDPRFGVGQWFGAGEETDLLLRALASGAAIRRDHSVRVHHRFLSASERKPMAGGFAAVRRRQRGAGAVYAKNHLPAWVVARGLVSPLLLSILRWQGYVQLRLAWATTLGRAEGYWRWKRMRGATS